MKRLFYIGCAPRPGVEMPMSRDDAALKIVEAFTDQYPECLIVLTLIKRTGKSWNFMISVRGSKEEDHECVKLRI